jgi:hypothetical protein
MKKMPIRKGNWSDEENIGALLSVSFTDDPFVRWLMPNSLDFLRDCKNENGGAILGHGSGGTVRSRAA